MALVQKFTSLLGAAGRCVPGVSGGPVALRHAPSGMVLTDGSGRGDPVVFASAAEAARFRARWLDAPAGWETVRLASVAPCAA